MFRSSYEGPYKVVEKFLKYFWMDIRGQIEAIPMGQIKLHLGPSCAVVGSDNRKFIG